jgi:predicted ArsR family transcriptional regulator
VTAPTVQEQARALGDPTRHAIFRHLSGAGRPLGVAELNERFPLNHNAIRQHLAKLVAAGLVLEAKAPTAGRGRPRLLYEVSPAAEGPWGTTGPYERLSALLVEIIRSGRGPVEVGRRAAEELRSPSPSGDAVADLTDAMARQGFDPELRATPDGAEIVLHRCPFASAATADRATICALHLGIAEGITEGTAVAVSELVANDPHVARCRLRVHLGDDEPAPSSATLTMGAGSPTGSSDGDTDEGGEAPCFAHLLP